MYQRIRQSQVAQKTDKLLPEMEKLQNAIKRVSANWNDVVAQGVQTMHVNLIVSACNSTNATMTAMSNDIEMCIERLEELERTSL